MDPGLPQSKIYFNDVYIIAYNLINLNKKFHKRVSEVEKE